MGGIGNKALGGVVRAGQAVQCPIRGIGQGLYFSWQVGQRDALVRCLRADLRCQRGGPAHGAQSPVQQGQNQPGSQQTEGDDKQHTVAQAIEQQLVEHGALRRVVARDHQDRAVGQGNGHIDYLPAKGAPVPPAVAILGGGQAQTPRSRHVVGKAVQAAVGGVEGVLHFAASVVARQCVDRLVGTVALADRARLQQQNAAPQIVPGAVGVHR